MQRAVVQDFFQSRKTKSRVSHLNLTLSFRCIVPWSTLGWWGKWNVCLCFDEFLPLCCWISVEIPGLRMKPLSFDTKTWSFTADVSDCLDIFCYQTPLWLLKISCYNQHPEYLQKNTTIFNNMDLGWVNENETRVRIFCIQIMSASVSLYHSHFITDRNAYLPLHCLWCDLA